MVKVRKDLTGMIFGRWRVLKQAEDHIRQDGRHESAWWCQCDCGSDPKIVVGSYLTGKNGTKSCGCLQREAVRKVGKKNKKTNIYDPSMEYGVGFCSNTGTPYYFDWEDFDKIKNYCWYEQAVGKNYHSVQAHDNVIHKTVKMCNIITGDLSYHINGDGLDNRKINLAPVYSSIDALDASLIKDKKCGFITINGDIYYQTEYGARYIVLLCKEKFNIAEMEFGQLTVICRTAPPDGVKDIEQSFWLCRCECGNYCVVRRKSLVGGTTKSCGCYHNEICSTKKHNNIFEIHEDICEVFDWHHNKSFFIDSEDIDTIKQYYWTPKKNGYVVACVNNETILLHRLLTHAPDDKIVDHKNRDPRDNRKCNLRLCETIENTRNKSLNINNKSGVMGVCQYQDGMWYAYIMMYGKNKHLYCGPNKHDAIIARLKAEKDLYKEFATQQHLFKKYGISVEEC